jgi:hypothetical protein
VEDAGLGQLGDVGDHDLSGGAVGVGDVRGAHPRIMAPRALAVEPQGPWNILVTVWVTGERTKIKTAAVSGCGVVGLEAGMVW